MLGNKEKSKRKKAPKHGMSDVSKLLIVIVLVVTIVAAGVGLSVWQFKADRPAEKVDAKPDVKILDNAAERIKEKFEDNTEEKSEEYKSEGSLSVEETQKTVGFINAGPNQYYVQFSDAFTALAKEYDIEVIEANSNYDIDKDLSHVREMIEREVDAIAVITAAASGSADSISLANEAGIPIFFIAGKPYLNPGSDLTGHVTDNFFMMGYMAGQWVAENYPDAKCVQIPGYFGQGPAEGEMLGFDLALKEAGMSPSIVLDSGEWQREVARLVVQELEDSGYKYDVIFAANEEMAKGVIDVLGEDSGKVIVSCNGKDDAWDFLADGTLSATVPNPPNLNADLCLQQIIRYFNDEAFIQYLQIKPMGVLTSENLDQAIPWILEDYLDGRRKDEFMWKLSDYERRYLREENIFEEFDRLIKDYFS